MLLTTVVLGAGCGNRLNYDVLRDAATATHADALVNAVPGAPTSPGAGTPVPTAGTAGARTANKPPSGGAVATTGQAAAGAVTAAAPPKRGKPAATGPSASAAQNAALSGICTKPLASIKIASVGHYSGVGGTLLVPGLRGLQAWVSWTNAKGGVNCHQIQLFVGDDGTDPATTQALVHDFVENRGVVAFVQMSELFTGQGVVKYLTDHKIPVIGSAGGQEWFNQNPTYFPQMASAGQYFDSVFAMVGAVDVTQGLKKGAVVACVEAPLCSQVYAAAAQNSARFGIDLVYRAQVTITQPNYTATCLAAKNAGAQVIMMGLDPNTDQRLARSCESVNYHPVYASPAVALLPSAAAYPALDGVQVSMMVLPWTRTSNPAMEQFLGAYTKYVPGGEIGASNVAGWVSGMVFGAAAAKVGDQPTSGQVLQGAFGIKKNDFDGMTQKLTYRAGAANQKQALMCWWAVQFHGATATDLNGGKETCQ